MRKNAKRTILHFGVHGEWFVVAHNETIRNFSGRFSCSIHDTGFFDCSTLKNETFHKHKNSFPFQYKKVLHGLVYLHDRNIIHRDIKGDNILISKNGRVCLADFGLAIRIDPDSPMSDDFEMDVAGTPYWLAPEVILMTAQTTASDIWSVGCKFWSHLDRFFFYFS